MISENNTIVLKSGRKLGYALYGSKKGTPLFYFHGWPSSRFDGTRVDKVAKKLNILVIAPDRPGIGISDYKKDRTLLGFPDDIVELADSLGFRKFSAMGVSGGGPYAAVCAYTLPKRVQKAAIVVGLAPPYIKNICEGMAWPNKMSWENYHRFPILSTLAGYSVFFQTKLGLVDISQLLSFGADRQMRNEDAYKALLNKVRKAVLQQGVKGIIQDLELYANSWGFDVKRIKIPVYLWYGEDDKNVSLAMGKYYKKRIPKSTLTVYEGGHLGWVKHAGEILKHLR
ncbi:MAG: alpha/beta hydrolase [Candidatus Roizmanbacteria bacterium]|nr:alpha/beta hydrolase [Candidatus Roizmanbacteria bacterium]